MTSNPRHIQDGGAQVVNILVFDLRVQLQHCTYQRETLLFALINVSTFICKREISGLSSPLTLSVKIYSVTILFQNHPQRNMKRKFNDFLNVNKKLLTRVNW